MRSLPLAVRLATMMIAIVIAASILTVTMDALKFRHVLRAQEELVYGFVAADLGETIEGGMNLGLPLAALASTEQLLQRRRAAEHGVVGITVFDVAAIVRFDTDRFRVGAPLPLEWAPPSPSAATWRGDLPGAGMVAARVENNFGQPAGGVVVRYDLTPLETRMTAILLDMVRMALAMAVASALAASVAAPMLTRGYRLWFGRVTAALAPGSHAVPPGADGVISTLREAEAELDATERALMRLGTGEGGIQGGLATGANAATPPGAGQEQGGNRRADLVLGPVEALERRLLAGSIAVTLLLLVLVTGAVSSKALDALEREVLPGLSREAAAVGAAVAGQIERAVDLGVPPDRLEGVDAFFDTLLTGHPALDSIALSGPDGASRQQVRRPGQQPDATQDVTVPVVAKGGPIGTLHIGVNRSLLLRSAADSWWDILIVLMVSLLATAEALVFLTDRTVSTPLRLLERGASRVSAGDWATRLPSLGVDAASQLLRGLNAAIARVNERWRHLAWLAAEIGRQVPAAGHEAAQMVARMRMAQLASDAAGAVPRMAPPRSTALARAPLFLFLLAEQLSTSFVPLFAKSLVRPRDWLPGALAVGLPIAVFAGTIALASPLAARLVERHGARAVLWAGCVPAALGYVGAALSGTVEGFAAARALSAVGYAAITLACQGYLVAAAEGGGRGRSMAVFVYAAMTGAVCGTAIGAVLADRLGYRATFVVSAALTLGAGALAVWTMDQAAGRRMVPAPGRDAVVPHAVTQGVARMASHSRGFMALVVFAAIPAKFVLSGFIFTIGPLVLQSMDQSQPEIGRQIMLYALAMLTTIRLGAWAADRLAAASTSIAAAGAAAGLGMMAILVLPPQVAVPLAIAVVGLAQGLASAPMLAVVPDLCPALAARVGVATLYGYLRSAERLGSIAGPVVAAGLVAAFGFTVAIAAIGAASLAATAAYVAVVASDRHGRRVMEGTP